MKITDRIGNAYFRAYDYLQKKLPQLKLKFLERYKKTTEYFGKAESIAKETTKTEFVVAHILKTLPASYRSLFPMTPLADDRLFSFRMVELGEINQYMKEWKKGGSNIVVITGERGCGKTTILRYIKRNILKKARYASIDRKISTEKQLCRSISKGKNSFRSLPKGVYLLDNLHNIFFRRIGGLDLLKDFTQSILLGKSFWIISIDEFAWNYLSTIGVLSESYLRWIDLRHLDEKNIELMVTGRQKGYKIYFEQPAEIPLELRYRYNKARKESERQEILRKMYFSRMHESTQGNPLLITLWWLHSIRSISKKSIIMGFEDVIDERVLQTISNTELLAIEAILQHECLGFDDFVSVFRSAPDKCQAILNSLVMKDLLIKEGKDYTMNPVYLVATNRLLDTRFKKGVYHD